ncbi:MAG: tRNA 2-thiouridine(34) synthase MnmA [Eggerthellaceae bacterium]|nr:tRNA 2-thiouridine(34) synthase MnmA [Eggerthellaceae bacterium]
MADAPRIALGMSGGVDSSVAVAALQAEGYEVTGVTLRMQDTPDVDASCRDAAAVCERLGARHVAVDATAAFDEAVVAPFAAAYAAGLTPSPCVGCNAAVKLPGLLRAADELGCEAVATGHYARVGQLAGGRRAVLAALDHRKDQSYMLALLTQDQLARLVLPLGGMTKLAVRAAAAEMGLAVADKPESQDICFAPEGYRAFLAGRGGLGEPGPIVRRDGAVVGRHEGLAGYTVGQRKGIGVAGPEPYYVLERRVADNALVVGPADEALLRRVGTGPVNWQAVEAPDAPLEAMVKLRYRSEPTACIITPNEGGGASVELREPQPLTAPGQWAVFYQGSTVLGGAMIEEVG